MDQVLLAAAELMATRSTCSRAHNGALFALDGRILATGYNGRPRGMPHCVHAPGETSDADDSGTLVTGCDSVHAEANAVAFAARHGIALEASTLYVTSTPCLRCAQLAVNCGVVQVVARRAFRLHDGVDLLHAAGVVVLFLDAATGTLNTVPPPT